MASAGRILIMPKGAYSASTTYEMLDMVSHNGTTWLAKKTVAGVEPSAANSEHWQNMFNMAASDYLPISGGTLKGRLGIDGGTGQLGANAYGTYWDAITDNKNLRGIRIDSPSYKSDATNTVKLVDVKDGVQSEYKLFGEHNLELLKTHVNTMIAEYLANN